MKKTFNINLNGQLFHVDDDAFDQLSKYLKSLEQLLKQEEGGPEILQDIEARIAELFQERSSSKSQIVTLIMVQDVIAQIGTPEELMGDEKEKQAPDQEESFTISRRLFRDGEEKMIGGVAAGIAAYFQIDPTIVRILVAILILSGVGFGFYLLLWIVIPEAKSPSEKLQMKGEPVNLKNLKDQANQEFKDFNSRMNSWIKKEPQNAFEKMIGFLSQILQFTLKTSLKIFKWIALSILIFFLVTFTILFIGLFVTGITIGSNHFLPSEISQFLIQFLPQGFDNFSFWSICLLIILAPVYWILSLSLRIIFDLPKNNPILKKINTSVGILTAIGWILAFVLGVQLAMEFRTKDVVTQTISLPNIQKYTLVNEKTELPNSDLAIMEDGVSWFMANQKWYQNQIEVEVNDSPDSTAFAKIVKISRGKDRAKAHHSAQVIQYPLAIDSSGKIILPSHFNFPTTQAFRGQEVRIKIFLPQNKEMIQKIDDQCAFPTVDRREFPNIQHLY